MKLPTTHYLHTSILKKKHQKEYNSSEAYEEDLEREQRRMEFLAQQSFRDEQLNEKDEE